MQFKSLFLPLAAISEIAAQKLEFTMSLSPPPQPGSKFEITWAPIVGGRLTIQLNNFDPLFPTLPIITTSGDIAILEDKGSYIWDVPLSLCGRHSFALSYAFERRSALSEIWNGVPCPDGGPTTVLQTTACIPTARPVNSYFIVPNANQYPYRAGQKSLISWTPTEGNFVSLYLEQEQTSLSLTIAQNVPNTGRYEWIPDPSLINLNQTSDLIRALPYRLSFRGTITNRSPSFFVLSKSYPNMLMNTTSWDTPTLGRPTTFLWSPSSEETISLHLVFGAGALPGASNTITIADKVPNTGSFTWNVPENFVTGQYILTSSSGRTGVRDPLIVSIIVGRTPLVACRGNQISTPSFSLSSSSVLRLSTTSRDQVATISSIRFEQILHHTGCPSPLTPIYTSTTISSTTTSFLTVGCPTSISITAPSCYPDYTTYTHNPTSTLCCPSNWRTSTIGEIWCFTSFDSPLPTRIASPGRRSLSPENELYIMNEKNAMTSGGGGGGDGLDVGGDILRRATETAVPERVITDVVFVRAGTVGGNDSIAVRGEGGKSFGTSVNGMMMVSVVAGMIVGVMTLLVQT